MDQKAKKLINKAAGLFDAGKLTDALQCFDKALEIDPRSAPAWADKGVCLARMGRFEEAKQCLDKALEEDPLLLFAWINEGGVFSDLGQFQEAIRCYDRALGIDPKNPDVWVWKGICFNKLRMFNEAIWCVDKALETDPKDTEAWFTKGESLESLGKQKEASECNIKALGIISQTYIDKGSSLFDAGQFEEAIECYEKAFETSEKSALDWFHKWLDEGKLQRISEKVDSKGKEPIIEALHIAETFRYYPKTSLMIIRLAAILTRSRETAGFEEFRRKVDLIYDTFKLESSELNAPSGNYWRECFDQVSTLLYKSINSLRGKESETLFHDLMLLHSRCLEIDERLRPSEDLAADLMCKTNRTTEESMLHFRLLCDTYLQGVEALFDDTIRMLYLFSEASTGKIRKFEEIKTANIWEIRQTYKTLFGISPVFLEPTRIDTIKNVRNAIAHAQADYNPVTGRVHFRSLDKDRKVVFDKEMHFVEFIVLWLEVTDTINSFRRSIDIMLVQALLTTSYLDS